jgi:SpoVK/Ycf46/Vps4 family AAA+-type ATPase
MIRRFDRVFPFFVPGAPERERIFRVMPRLTGVAYAAGTDFTRVTRAVEGLTGSALESIVRRAMELAWPGPVGEADLLAAVDDYKPNHDPAVYRFQSLLALGAANLFSSLPPAEDLPDEIRELVMEMRRRCSARPLHERLDAVRRRGGRG